MAFLGELSKIFHTFKSVKVPSDMVEECFSMLGEDVVNHPFDLIFGNALEELQQRLLSVSQNHLIAFII